MSIAVPSPRVLQRAHVTNIGGAGMSAVAALLLARDSIVSGSDANDTPAMAVLRSKGARTTVGYDPGIVDDLDATTVIVRSTATRDDNPQLVRARERGLTILHRSEALAALMADRRQVAVAGTHGKSTTTSMIAIALSECGLDPSYAIGADLAGPGTNARAGAGAVFVVEADESDGSFLRTAPEVAIVTNIEPDHLDYWGSEQALNTAFLDYARGVVTGGTLVACLDDQGARSLAEQGAVAGLSVKTYGSTVGADLELTAIELDASGSRFVPVMGGRSLGEFSLQVPGGHNVANAGAALLAGLLIGAPVEGLRAGLASFTGARRRFDRKGVVAGVTVVDDYAHHPTEVAANVAAARSVAGAGRVLAVFQPHLYSRTAALATQFGEALAAADEVVVLDIYGARELPVAGVSGQLIADAVATANGRVHYAPAREQVVALIASLVRKGDLVLMMGAGDISELAQPLLDAIGVSAS